MAEITTKLGVGIAGGLIPSGGASGPAGGDLDGFYPNPTVDGLQGRAVANTAPTNGQGLIWNTALSRWEPTTISTGGTVCVTVNSGGGADYTSLDAAIVYVRSKNGGTIVVQEAFVYTATNQNVTNICFKGRNPNVGTGAYVQFQAGNGVWTGANVTFENFMFSTRNTYLGTAPFAATTASYWTFNNCRFGASGNPGTAKPLFNAAGFECYVTFNNSQQVQTTKPFSINDTNVTLNLYNGSYAAVTSINTLNVDAGSYLISGAVVTTNKVDRFIRLGDAPSTFAGSGGKFVAVNGGATALEFVAAPAGLTVVRGRATIANLATSVAIVFPVPFADTAYTIGISVVEVTPGVGNVNTFVSSGRTAAGFTANISAPPGLGNSLEIHWTAIHD